MKKSIVSFGVSLAVFFTAFFALHVANAQMMGEYGWTYPWTSSSSEQQTSASDTEAIAAGQALYQQLQSGQVQCNALTQNDFENLGEYFMQQVTGAGHPAMDAMISNMMGEEGNTAIHIAWGERYSGCNGNESGARSTPYNNKNLTMMGYYNGYSGYNPMMSGWGFGFGWVFQMIFGILIAVAIIVLIVWIVKSARYGHRGMRYGGSALDILNERYAKGEIAKKEYEEKKKDLSA